MRDEINKEVCCKNECFILNTDHSSNSGTHWTGLFTKNGETCYFDPYGIEPPPEIKKYCKEPRIYNTFQIQKPSEVICGHYCIYVLWRLSNGEDFYNILDELYNYSINTKFHTGGFLNNIIEKLGEYNIELHLAADKGEYIQNGSFNGLQKYSFAGPGTRYLQRVKEGYVGINELDQMAKLHDEFYNENSDTKLRNISDRALAHRAEEIANDPMIDEPQRRDAKLVKTLMENKARFGLGPKKSKN